MFIYSENTRNIIKQWIMNNKQKAILACTITGIIIFTIIWHLFSYEKCKSYDKFSNKNTKYSVMTGCWVQDYNNYIRVK